MLQPPVNSGGEINILLLSFPTNVLNLNMFPKAYVRIWGFYDAPFACINIPLS